MKFLPLSCTWASGIDIDGLNPDDKVTILKIGLDKWMDSIHEQRIQRENDQNAGQSSDR